MDREEKMRWAAKHGDWPTYESLGGSRTEFDRMHALLGRKSSSAFSRGIV